VSEGKQGIMFEEFKQRLLSAYVLVRAFYVSKYSKKGCGHANKKREQGG
jgi:hypothetical protein